MKSTTALLLAAAFYAVPALTGPPSNDSPFPASLSQCGGKYSTDEANSTNYYRCSDWNDGIDPADDQKFLVYDAYYNGTLNLNYIPIGASTRRPYLAPVNSSFAIGQMNLPNSQITRSKWDANNFYMGFNSFPPPCNSTETCAPWFAAQSSSSFWYWSQAWTLTDTKNGDGYDISGNVSKTHAMGGGNSFYFSLPADATSTSITSYNDYDIFANDYVSMVGHVSATAINVTFTATNFHIGSGAPFATLQYVFTGQPWKAGAQLVTTGDHPTTTGQAKSATAGAPASTSTSSTGSSISKTIIGAATGGGILLILIFIGLIFCCCLGTVANCFRRSKKQRVMDQQFQQQQQPIQAAQYGPPPGPYPMQPVQQSPYGNPGPYLNQGQHQVYQPPGYTHTGNPQY